jgi:hypothetical protein
MLASYPASILNHKTNNTGIPNRFRQSLNCSNKQVGTKRPFTQKQIWAVRFFLDLTLIGHPAQRGWPLRRAGHRANPSIMVWVVVSPLLSAELRMRT